MQDVADRAGLSVTSLYARFDGKAALVLALHERTIASGLDAIDAFASDTTRSTGSLQDVVRALIDATATFAERHRHVFRAVLAVVRRLPA